jgi:hypothetical protein
MLARRSFFQTCLGGLLGLVFKSKLKPIPSSKEMDLNTLEWESKGGMEVNFKVMSIMVPKSWQGAPTLYGEKS